MAPGSGHTGIIADCPHQYLRCAVLINRCKQAERAELMRREEQVKPGDVPLRRADPQRNKGAGGRAAGQIKAESDRFKIKPTQQTHLS